MFRVLIVDDQPFFRRQLVHLLRRAGMHVVGEAEDIPTAERLARAQQPNLAFVDMMLPGVDGPEGISRLKEILPSLRVILVSAFCFQFTHEMEYMGAEAFIPKDELDLATVEKLKVGNY